MNKVTVALTLLLAAAILGGCGDDGGTTDGSVMTDAGPGETLFYVAQILALGNRTEVGGDTLVDGVNLDGVDSDALDPAGCQHVDYASPAPDNEAGVDNELGPTLVGLGGVIDVDASLEESVLDGSLLLLFELEDVNDRINDPDVTLNIYIGALPDGVDAPVDADGDGLIDANQTFDIAAGSIMDGESTVSVGGAIVNGRLSAGPVDIAIDLPVAGGLPLNIKAGQVRFSIAGDTATSGLIAGGLDVEELIVTLGSLDSLPVSEAVVRGFLETAADLDPDAAGECASVSVALKFEGVTAMRGVVAM